MTEIEIMPLSSSKSVQIVGDSKSVSKEDSIPRSSSSTRKKTSKNASSKISEQSSSSDKTRKKGMKYSSEVVCKSEIDLKVESKEFENKKVESKEFENKKDESKEFENKISQNVLSKFVVQEIENKDPEEKAPPTHNESFKIDIGTKELETNIKKQISSYLFDM